MTRIIGMMMMLLASASSGSSAGPGVQARPHAAFDIVPLGVKGGLDAGSTTAWYIAATGSRRGIACDAGTLTAGIRVGIRHGAFGPKAQVADVLHTRIAAYLVTHAHLDHVAGLVIASPDDTPKPIFALPPVHAAMTSSYFNWSAWPNLTDRGSPPRLGVYTLRDLIADAPATPVPGTELAVSAFPLSHGGAPSTAFLIHAGRDAILCMGDTGPDAVERSKALSHLWSVVAPLIRAGRLRAILIETSYPDPRPDDRLFGHLTPRWLHIELTKLVETAGSIANVPIVIGHIKPSLSDEDDAPQRIMTQLAAPGGPDARYIRARQGRALHF